MNNAMYSVQNRDTSLNEFQTPPDVCEYMVSLLPKDVYTVYEPTPGNGNLVKALENSPKKFGVYTSPDFFYMDYSMKFDAVLMNPPFSCRSAFSVPEVLEQSGMRLGYYILQQCMDMSDNIIALMPWFTLTDSDRRTRDIKDFGLVSVTALPRRTFKFARIQTMILELKRGYKQTTEFKVYDRL